MRIYLAARYSRRDELCRYADDLQALGHEVTSRWLLGGHQVSDSALADEHGDQGYATSERQRFAEEDWEDLMAADWCVAVTEAPRTGPSRGGRMVELGAALAWGKRVIVVGHRENVFCCLPHVEFYPDWPACLAVLASEVAGRGLAQ